MCVHVCGRAGIEAFVNVRANAEFIRYALTTQKPSRTAAPAGAGNSWLRHAGIYMYIRLHLRIYVYMFTPGVDSTFGLGSEARGERGLEELRRSPPSEAPRVPITWLSVDEALAGFMYCKS